MRTKLSLVLIVLAAVAAVPGQASAAAPPAGTKALNFSHTTHLPAVQLAAGQLPAVQR